MKKILTEEEKKHIRGLYDNDNIINIDFLKDLTNKEIKLLFTIEDTHNLPNSGKLGDIKKYILNGKNDFSMGEKINRIEKLSIPIIIDRWLNSVEE